MIIAPQTAEQYMQFLKDTSWYKHAGHNDSGEIAYLALGLAGETGEFVDQVKKIVRVSGFNNYNEFRRILAESGREELLVEELGDVLWYMTRLMDVLNIDIQELMVRNTYKLYARLREKPEFKDLEWPFTDPFISYENVKERIDHVCID
ncbi:hypothetical protein LCGC14_0481360 [marine sediment metagenome]|uniref:NTP pyrophosphohydrolase MazG-like domain-containing protein n=1 Tax=marine sediment metagenome TaxID=412755 RepID=A0A0F9UW60_9ZZZZ